MIISILGYNCFLCKFSRKDNCPRARDGKVSWFDESNQISYLFGGQEYDKDEDYKY